MQSTVDVAAQATTTAIPASKVTIRRSGVDSFITAGDGRAISPKMLRRAQCAGCGRRMTELDWTESWNWYVAKSAHICSGCEQTIL
jgi:hypothetical protein